MWSALLNSIASGTFIYVAITEVRQPLATHDTDALTNTFTPYCSKWHSDDTDI